MRAPGNGPPVCVLKSTGKGAIMEITTRNNCHVEERNISPVSRFCQEGHRFRATDALRGDPSPLRVTRAVARTLIYCRSLLVEPQID